MSDGKPIFYDEERRRWRQTRRILELSGLGLSALSGSLAMGAVAFFVVAAAGALWRARSSRAIRWARQNPWRFAVLPALACAAIALVLTVVTGGGVLHGVLSGLWHGGAVYGLTGAAGLASKSRKKAASS